MNRVTIIPNNIFKVAVNQGLQKKKRVLNFLLTNPDSEGIYIRNEVAPELPMSTFYGTLSRMKITYKKEPKYKGRSEVARREFIEFISQTSLNSLVYCDEMGVSNNLTTLYGWSERGKYLMQNKLALLPRE